MTGVTKSMQKVVEKRLADRTRRLRQWAEGSIRTYTEYLQAETQKLVNAEKTAREEVDKWAEALQALKQARLKAETNDWDLGIVVQTTEKSLTKVYKAIGRLDPQTLEKDIQNAEKKTIRVALRSVKYPNVTVVYVRKLKDGDKCKIETVDVPATKEHRLVCGR